jgi:hypothetical protein
VSAFFLDDIVVGGGNAKKLKKVPSGYRLGHNANAFIGGFRMWEAAAPVKRVSKRPRHRLAKQTNGARA